MRVGVFGCEFGLCVSLDVDVCLLESRGGFGRKWPSGVGIVQEFGIE